MRLSGRGTRAGLTLVEALMAATLALLMLVVAWSAFTTVSRHDAGARWLADRLETQVLVHALLERDLSNRAFHEDPRVEAGGQAVVIPAHPTPAGAADGPRGSAPIRSANTSTVRAAPPGAS